MFVFHFVFFSDDRFAKLTRNCPSVFGSAAADLRSGTRCRNIRLHDAQRDRKDAPESSQRDDASLQEEYRDSEILGCYAT